MTTKMNANQLPHEIMYELATDEGRYFEEDIITKDGNCITISRRLSIKERLMLLQGCASYFAPTLKAVEARATLDFSDTSLEELKAKALTLAADLVRKEKKSAK